MVTNTRPLSRRGTQIPDERVSRGTTPLAPTNQVGSHPSHDVITLESGFARRLPGLPCTSPIEGGPEPTDLNVPFLRRKGRL